MKSILLVAAATAHRPHLHSMLQMEGVTDTGKWIPDRYSTGEDDQLMKNLIEKGLAFTVDEGFDDKYQFMTHKGCTASEERCLCCMQKHTHWWVDKEGALGAAKELVGTNLHMEGADLSNFLAEKFPEIWKKYDVLDNGWIEVERMALFYKELMGDWKVSIQ